MNANQQFTVSERKIYWIKISEIGTNDWKRNEDLTADYGGESWNEDEKELVRLLQIPFTPLYEGRTNRVEYCAKSGWDGAEAIYGTFNINEKECYFVITDDEGMSGYDCCGIITLQYSYDVKDFLNECYKINKNDYSTLKSILNVSHEAEGEVKINEWMDNFDENAIIDTYLDKDKSIDEITREEENRKKVLEYMNKPDVHWDYSQLSKNPIYEY